MSADKYYENPGNNRRQATQQRAFLFAVKFLISRTIVLITDDCYIHRFVVKVVDNAKLAYIFPEVGFAPLFVTAKSTYIHCFTTF